ncbi:hypothetical protein [Brevibacterium moorei]|jgi:hypothetical protein|uniref:hypothetical protein n=1 Tax=Brevibacterium moorei TaxID=2968457 RepID=UPI00211C28B4|nr:hypothetical protein [Brevibacterium sp. 68QC2CO]MCQ9386415.1 hypothetical protein [Brevibacterium sp. 68QC2CO]
MTDTTNNPTRFQLDVDLSAMSGDPAEELARVLRYWAGAMKSIDLGQPVEQAIYDSEYKEVGNWRLTE